MSGRQNVPRPRFPPSAPARLRARHIAPINATASSNASFGARPPSTTIGGPAEMRSALQRTTRHASLRTLGMRSMSSATPLAALDRFEPRHLGPRVSDHPEMLATIGVDSVSDLVTKTVPSQILLDRALDLGKVRRGSHARAARDEQHHTEWPGKRRVSDLRTQP